MKLFAEISHYLIFFDPVTTELQKYYFSRLVQLEQLLQDEHLSQEVSDTLQKVLLDYKSALQGGEGGRKLFIITRLWLS